MWGKFYFIFYQCISTPVKKPLYSQVFRFWSTEECRFTCMIFFIDHLKKLDHRLHMELDLQSLFGSMCIVHSSTHWLRPHNSPPPPRIRLVYDSLLVSQDIDDISLWPPWAGLNLFCFCSVKKQTIVSPFSKRISLVCFNLTLILKNLGSNFVIFIRAPGYND